MSATLSLSAQGTQPSASSSGGLTVLLLAISAFVIVTTEFIIIGLLPALASDLGLSIAVAGQLVTLFAFTVMLFGPILTALVSHFDRKRLFITILVLFAVSNTAVALAPDIWVLALGRFLPALALPVFWGTASETAAQLVGPDKSGKAVANVYMGIAAAMVLGIPLGTVASTIVGWRGTFAALAILSAVMAVMLLMVMPTLARPTRLRLMDQARILKDPFFLGNVVLSVVVFTAAFTGYTYLADTLQHVAGIPSDQVGWWLMGFGVVGLAGNWLGGYFVGKSPLGATAAVTAVFTVGVACVTPLADHHVLLAITLVIWGIANTAMYPICQVRVMTSASHAQALAGTLNVSMANAGIGLGAIIGGSVIQNWGLPTIGYVAASIGVLAVLIVPLVAALKPKPSEV